MIKVLSTVRRRVAAVAVSLFVVAGVVVGGAAPASASTYYELPYPAGEAYRVTQGNWGWVSHQDIYNRYAWDFAMPYNYEVSAAQSGTVIASGWSPYWQNGIEVIIRHPNGQCTQYLHLNRATHRVGSWVPQGRVIGWSGSTGRSSGPHLHYQVINCYNRVSIPSYLQGWKPGTGSWPVSVNRYA